MLRGNTCGNDFNFHLLSWMEVRAAWQSGTLYPHWAAHPNYEAGEPRFVFYPPASWALGGALAAWMGGSVRAWTALPGVFIFLVLTLAGYSALALLRGLTSKRAALFAACLYLAGPYALFVAYERSAFAELMAAIWMPLLFLFALQRPVRTLPLALTIAALWLTNAPAAVIGSYALALLVLVAALLERSWQPVLRAATSVTLGLGLAAFYVLPAAYERRWVQIDRAISDGMRPADNFLFGHTADPYHDGILRMVSWIAVALLALAGALLSTMYFSLRRRHKLPPKALRFLLPVSVLAPVLGVLLLPVSLPVWQHLPEFRYVQFPWRLLLPLSVVVAALLGMAARNAMERVHLLWMTAPVLAAVGVALGWQHFHQFCYPEDTVPAQVAAFHSGQGAFEGTDEYAPWTAETEDLPDAMPLVSLVPLSEAHDPDTTSSALPAGASVRVERWTPEHKRAVFFMPASAGANGPQAAVLRLLDYPFWRVRANGRPLSRMQTPSPPGQQGFFHTVDGRIVVPLHSGQTVLTVDHTATPDVWLGRGISLLALLACIVIFIKGKIP